MFRYVTVPETILFKLRSGEPDMVNILMESPSKELPEGKIERKQRSLTFEQFIERHIACHPKWSSPKATRVLFAFWDAFDKARAAAPQRVDGAGCVIEMSEEVWKEVYDAVEKPMHQVPGGMGGMQSVPGFAHLPGMLAMQVLPFVDTFDDPPKKRPVPESPKGDTPT